MRHKAVASKRTVPSTRKGLNAVEAPPVSMAITSAPSRLSCEHAFASAWSPSAGRSSIRPIGVVQSLARTSTEKLAPILKGKVLGVAGNVRCRIEN